MTGLIKIICERNYGNPNPSPNDPTDIRVFHVEPQNAQVIVDWFRSRQWDVTEEPI